MAAAPPLGGEERGRSGNMGGLLAAVYSAAHFFLLIYGLEACRMFNLWLFTTASAIARC